MIKTDIIVTRTTIANACEVSKRVVAFTKTFPNPALEASISANNAPTSPDAAEIFNPAIIVGAAEGSVTFQIVCQTDALYTFATFKCFSSVCLIPVIVLTRMVKKQNKKTIVTL